MSSLGTTARVLGPAIGGLVVAFAGPGVAFGLNALVPRRSSAACSRSTPRACCARAATPRRRCSAAPQSRCASSATRARALVAFVAVFALSTFSFNFNVLLPLVADQTLHSGARGVRPDRRRVRGGRAARRDDQRDRRPREPAPAARRRRGVRPLRALLAPQHSLPIVCVLLFATGDHVHALGHERALDDPARGAGAPARPRGGALLLRVPRRRAGRRPVLRLADREVGGTQLAFFAAGWSRSSPRLWGIVRLRRTAPQRAATAPA